MVPPAAVNVKLYAEPMTPPGRDDVVTVRDAAMLRVRLLVAVRCVGLLESVAVITTVAVPADVGVPPITPVDAFIVNPPGRPEADQARGVLPPVAVAVAV